MRYAVVVAPPRFHLHPGGSVFAAPEPVGPVCAALARGGRLLMFVPTTADLAFAFERAVERVTSNDDLVVYIAAAIGSREDAAVLLVEGDARPDERPVELQFMGAAVASRRPSAALFVVEAYHAGYENDPILAAGHVERIVGALGARANGFGAAIGVRSHSPPEAAAWPFTSHVLATIDAAVTRNELAEARMSSVLDELRATGAFDPRVQSFAFVGSQKDLVIVSLQQAASPALEDDPQGAVHPARDSASSVIDRSWDTVANKPSLLYDDDREAQRPEPPSHSPSALNGASHDAGAIGPTSLPMDVAVIPEPRATQPSLPAIEPLVKLANDARERGALSEALAGYKAALMVADPLDQKTRASIYLHIGELKHAQGKQREAESNFEKALSANPELTSAFFALVNLATENNDAKRAIDLRRRRLANLVGADQRVSELLAIAELYADSLHDDAAAAEVLDQALSIPGQSRSVLVSLRNAYEKLQRWHGVVDVHCAIAESIDDRRERSVERFAGADIALARLRDEPRGLRLLELALDDDPTNEKAIRAFVAVRTAGGEWAAIDHVYSGLIDRFAAIGDVERAWDTCRKLGLLRRDKLHDAPGAVRAFCRAVDFKPDNVDSRGLLAETHIAAGDEALAVAEFERIAEYAPTRSSTYARLFALHRRAGKVDRAWLAGSVLAELGNADMDQQLFLDQYRLDGPIRPTRSLDDAAWDELLRAPGSDEIVTGVLSAIGSTAAAVRVEELRQARLLLTLDPTRRQSAAATVSAVRSFYWAAQVLDVVPPDLYVMDNVPGGVAAVHARTPTTALGPDVLRGLATKDLAFLAGRHLTYYRPEHYALVCYPTLQDISALFLGAVKLILPELEAPAHIRDAVAHNCKVLAKQATEDEKHRLAAAVERLQARGGRADLAAWIRSVELSAQRAGLLLCGDLAVCTARLRVEKETRAIADLTFEDKRRDLLAFCASEKLARARALLGVDAHPSMGGAISANQPQA
jgi:tetratricopeptide (TPR) repeat protein